MANYLVTDTDLTSVADAIRTKGGTSASLEFPDDFVQAIEDIPSGGGGGTTITITSNVPDNQKGIYVYDSGGTLLYSGTCMDLFFSGGETVSGDITAIEIGTYI